MTTDKVSFIYNPQERITETVTTGSSLTFVSESGKISRRSGIGSSFRDFADMFSGSSMTFKFSVKEYREIILQFTIYVNGVSRAEIAVNGELITGAAIKYQGYPGTRTFSYNLTSVIKVGENTLDIKCVSNLNLQAVAVVPGFKEVLFPQMFVVDGIEVTQAVQDMDHNVPLIRHKKTYVRVYISPGKMVGKKGVTSADSLKLKGRLKVTQGEYHVHHLDSENEPSYAVVESQNTLLKKRNDAAHSLNFILPHSCTVGKVTVETGDLSVIDASGTATRVWHETKSQSVTFVASPPLRLRVIGLDYTKADGTSCRPRATDYQHIKSWLTRAFPVESVEFSSIVSPAGSIATENDEKGVLLFLQLAALRNLDMANSAIDRRTHYYGLIYDERIWVDEDDSEKVDLYTNPTFMRGAAYGVGKKANPTNIGYGPTGQPLGKYSGGTKADKIKQWSDARSYHKDTDASYGDWYTAHELGHTFGRSHVNSNGKESRPEKAYPYASGQIGDAKNPYVGFDVGDADLKIEAAALPYTDWYDIMGYKLPQWIGRHTYEALRERLIEENKLREKGKYGNSCAVKYQEGNYLNVIGRADHRDKKFTFEYINPVNGGFLPNPTLTESDSKLRIHISRTGSRPTNRTEETPVKVKSKEHFDCLVKVLYRTSKETVTKIEFLRKEDSKYKVKATYVVPTNATAVKDVAVANGVGGTRSVTWKATGGSPVFNVQLSHDGGRHWETVAVGLKEPKLTLHTEVFPDLSKIQLRVMATNGVGAVYSAPLALSKSAPVTAK